MGAMSDSRVDPRPDAGPGPGPVPDSGMPDVGDILPRIDMGTVDGGISSEVGGPPVREIDPCAPDTDLRAAVTFDEVQPHETDPAIRNETEGDLGGYAHLFADPVGAPNGKLFLWIMGTDPGFFQGMSMPGGPVFYQEFLRQAAGVGYHTLGLIYINELPINAVCSRGAPADCNEQARIEVITGRDTSPLPDVQVSEADSIVNRVRAALRHRGWTQFLDEDGEPLWDRIAVGGHSQGGGHAAMIGRLFEVERVIMTASTEGADWTIRNDDFATPADRYWGITSEFDLARTHLRSWANLGAPGVPTSVDDGLRPTNGSQRLTVTLDPRDDNHHGTVILDVSTPLNGFGHPVLRDVWCYMLGE